MARNIEIAVAWYPCFLEPGARVFWVRSRTVKGCTSATVSMPASRRPFGLPRKRAYLKKTGSTCSRFI